MYYMLDGHEFLNEVQATSQIFYPNEKFIEADSVEGPGTTTVSRLKNGVVETLIYENGVLSAADSDTGADSAGGMTNGQAIKKRVRLSVYRAFSRKSGYLSPWGALTGVRPTKIVHELWATGYDEPEIYTHLNCEHLVSPGKIRLLMDIARAEREIIRNNNENTVALYIGIPFCASRCLYCSFTSYELGRFDADGYISALLKEIKAMKPFFYNKELESVYIGGGTPTALSAAGLKRLLDGLTDLTTGKHVKEFTVEAGRPDTVDSEKLMIMKERGVTRISLNPQTMHDKTLKAIGRAHTADEYYKKMELARAEGFSHINTDLIMGLPHETPAHVLYTFNAIKSASPEAVTVHTLAVKRASRLAEELTHYPLPDTAAINEMLDISRLECEKMQMRPYYMYRQKNMAGNLENVGYCKTGFHCIYNVQIMEEKQTVIAMGAGGVTKLYFDADNRVERIFNVKGPDEYIRRIDEMIERKKTL